MRVPIFLVAGSALVAISGLAAAQALPANPAPAPGVPASPTNSKAMPSTNPESGAATPEKQASLARIDAYFVQQAASGNQDEIATAKLAEQKSSNSQVKDFARKMIEDHTKAGNQLKQIAEAKGASVTPDTAKINEDKKKLDSLSGASFDRHYVNMEVKDHEKMIKLFKDEQKNGSDTALKSFAETTLPTLESHLTMAKDLHGSLSGTASTAEHQRNRTASSENR